MLLRKHKAPEMLTRSLGTFFANLMPLIILVQAAAAFMFLYMIADKFNI